MSRRPLARAKRDDALTGRGSGVQLPRGPRNLSEWRVLQSPCYGDTQVTVPKHLQQVQPCEGMAWIRQQCNSVGSSIVHAGIK